MKPLLVTKKAMRQIFTRTKILTNTDAEGSESSKTTVKVIINKYLHLWTFKTPIN